MGVSCVFVLLSHLLVQTRNDQNLSHEIACYKYMAIIALGCTHLHVQHICVDENVQR
jgi:hypothetical protein